MGPVISPAAKERIERLIQSAVDEVQILSLQDYCADLETRVTDQLARRSDVFDGLVASQLPGTGQHAGKCARDCIRNPTATCL